MRRVLAVAAAALVAAIAVLPAAPAAADDRISVVSVSGVMKITDDDIGDNVVVNVPINGSRTLTSTNRIQSLSFSGCAGGEVRVELQIVFVRLPSGTVRVANHAKLYEGWWGNGGCSSDDQNGDKQHTVEVPLGAQRGVDFTVEHAAPLDWSKADIKYQAVNTAL